MTDTRIRKIFALLPTTINGKLIWFSNYMIKELHVTDDNWVIIEKKEIKGKLIKNNV